MLSKLPGVFSEKIWVRILSRIYYSILFLLFVMIMFSKKDGLCIQDKILNVIEMFLFFMAFAAPVAVVAIMKKKGCRFPEIMGTVFLVAIIFMTLSASVENLYTDDYKANMYTQTDMKQPQK